MYIDTQLYIYRYIDMCVSTLKIIPRIASGKTVR